MSIEIFTWENDFGQKTIVTADVILSAKDTRTAEPTQHPVEDLTYISDHVIHNPDKLAVSLAHSNEPIDEGAGWSRKSMILPVIESRFKPQGLFAISQGIAGALSKAKPAPKAYVLTATRPKDRIIELHDALILALQSSALCVFTFRGRIYRNMVITSVTRLDEPGTLPVFDLECVNIRTVSSANANLPDPKDFHAKPEKKRGPKPKKAPAAEETKAIEGAGSMLRRLIVSGGDALSGGIL